MRLSNQKKADIFDSIKVKYTYAANPNLLNMICYDKLVQETTKTIGGYSIDAFEKERLLVDITHIIEKYFKPVIFFS